MPPRRSARAAAAPPPPKAATPSPSPPPAQPAQPTKVYHPLRRTRICVSGAFAGQSEKDISTKAKDLGAVTTASVTKTVTHLITSQANFDHDAPKVKSAKAWGHVKIVSVDWLDECETTGTHVAEDDYILTATAAAAAAPASATANGKKRAASPDSPATAAATTTKRTKRDTKDTKADASKPVANGKAPPSGGGAASKVLANSKLKDKAVKTANGGDGQTLKKKDIVVPLDEGCTLHSYAVFVDNEGLIYDASLNQTNASNNNNKFYRLQLLKCGNDFKTWTRWGRVGESGQNAVLGGGTFADAQKNFFKKFKDKSGLAWEMRTGNPKPGKYTFVERSYDPDSDEEDDEAEADGDSAVKDEEEWTPPVSKLDGRIQSLMALIFNQQFMQNAMADLNYDANKLPLGKLSKGTITRGFQALKNLAALFDDQTLAQTTYQMSYGAAVEMLSNQYYSIIPHAFGRNRPPVISTEPMLKKEVELMESLGDMKEAAAIMKAERPKDTVHQFDRQYAGLGMNEMTPLEHDSTEFKELENYMLLSCGATHRGVKSVDDIFRIERDGEHDRFNNSIFSSVPKDRRLLWHGSRTTNFGGILSQGLRIAPPEAPVSGYMFGKGIYLADMSSKSVNYCCSYQSQGQALLLLCEAELGNPMQELVQASYTAGDTAKAKGQHSTWGKGTTGPLKWKDAGVVHEDLKGVEIPDLSIKPGPTGVQGASLLYNEYIAYDVNQVRLRYLFRVRT